MRSTTITFTRGGERLAGRVFIPYGAGPWPGVVLVHGLGSGGKTMDGAARSLAALGIAALRFDQRGHGRSGGVYTGDSSEDIVAAAEQLSRAFPVDKERIAVMGHSSGAREVLLACWRSPALAAVVCTSTPGDANTTGAADGSGTFFHRIGSTRGGRVHQYPRDGALPWLEGRLLQTTSRLWSRAQGYRLRVRWDETLAQWGRLRPSVAVQEMQPRPLLLVHCQGDRSVPPVVSEVLYQKAAEPKELLLAPGGWHAAPLLRGPVRAAWTAWLAKTLHAEVTRGITT